MNDITASALSFFSAEPIGSIELSWQIVRIDSICPVLLDSSVVLEESWLN